MTREIVRTADAPQSPSYSQAVKAGAGLCLGPRTVRPVDERLSWAPPSASRRVKP